MFPSPPNNEILGTAGGPTQQMLRARHRPGCLCRECVLARLVLAVTSVCLHCLGAVTWLWLFCKQPPSSEAGGEALGSSFDPV